MSELTKQALKVDNNQSFPNNNAGLITPTALRAFNENMIDSTVNQTAYTADSASFNSRINALSGSGGSAMTGSLLTTASFNNSTRNLTFTKGDSSQFSVNIPDVSGSTLPSGVVSGSSQISYPLISNIPAGIVSGSSQLTGSFVTTNTNQTITGVKTFQQGPANTPGIEMFDTTKIQFAGFSTTRIGSSGGKSVLLEAIANDGSNTIGITSGVSGSITGGANTLTLQALGNQTGSEILLSAPRVRIIGDTTITGSFTSSLQQGFVLVGDASGRTQAVSTGSFGGGTFATGSFATTGSNVFIGNQTITGSLFLSSSVSASIIVPNTFGVFGLVIDGNVRIQNGGLDIPQAINAGGIYLQTIGRNDNNPINVDNGLNIRPNSPGLLATNVSISGSVIVSQSLQIGSTLTASIQEGFTLVGAAGNVSTLVATSSFGGALPSGVVSGSSQLTASYDLRYALSGSGGGALPSGLLSSSVTNFTDYSQSVDTRINNIVAGTGFATTGSNTFTGNQNIQGTLTASIQQGFVLAGGAGNVSTLVATSSFGGGGGGFPFVGDAQITGSLTISSSAGIDLDVIGGARITGSLLLTGSSIFTGDQTFVDGAGNTITLSDASGSLMLVAKTFTSASLHLTASAGNQVNIIFKDNNNTTDTIISGSNNIFTNPTTAPGTGFKRIIGSNNIVNSAAGMTQVTGSSTPPLTITSNYFGSNPAGIRGALSGSGYTITNNVAIGTINIGSPLATAAQDFSRAGAATVTTNFVNGTIALQAGSSSLLPTIAATPSIGTNIVNGSATATMNSSSISLTSNIIPAASLSITNNYFSGSAGSGSLTVRDNLIGSRQISSLIVQGSNPAGTVTAPLIGGNIIYGTGNAIHINADNSRVSGTTLYASMEASAVIGNTLAVTGSSLFSDLTGVGSAFFGRFNANDGIRNKTSEVVFAVGTGTATGTRKTGFLIDSGSNTFVEGTLNVSGSSVFTGSLILSSSATTELQVIGGVEITGSLGIQSGSSFFANGNRQFNVGAFQSDITQSGSANVSQSMNFEVTDISEGVSIASNSRITLANSGTYNIQFSVQVDRVSGSGTDTVHIWLKKNGTNVPKSAGAITIAGSAAEAKTVAAWNYIVNAAANDYYELVWQSTDSNIQLINVAATGNIPSTPSIILTVTQVR